MMTLSAITRRLKNELIQKGLQKVLPAHPVLQQGYTGMEMLIAGLEKMQVKPLGWEPL
jgi:hypothetical protein